MKKKLYILLVIIASIALLIGIAISVKFVIKHRYVANAVVTAGNKTIRTTIKKDNNKPDINVVAILGIDTRSGDYDGSRSDCIMLASVNDKTKEVKLASIYRDTYVYIEGHGYDKITHAYAYGGPELALKTINDYLDLNITEYVVVNFDSLIELVDSLGGVEIDITQEEIQYLKTYAKSYSGYDSSIETPGTYLLNGAEALAYSRIRYTSGGDFARTDRMRNIVIAGFNKAKKSDIVHLAKLVKVLFPKVRTNVGITDILAYVPHAKSYNIVKSAGWPYETQFYNGKASYVVPNDLEENVIKFHEEFLGEENYTPSENVKKYSKEINDIINK